MFKKTLAKARLLLYNNNRTDVHKHERGDTMKNNEMILVVEGARQGDRDCQLTLLERYKPLMLSMIRRYTYQPEQQEDYLSEAAIVLLSALNSYNEERGVPFGGYLKKELFYYFVNVAKKHHNLVSLDTPPGDDDSFSLLETLADDHDFSAELIHREELTDLERYLPRLRPRQRWIIIEHYGKNRSFRELAQSLGVTPNSLVKLHRRAIADLRSHFGLDLIN